MTTLVLIPAFNEQETVADVVSEVLRVGLPVLVVNDGSSDRTAIEARAAGAHVLSLPLNLGVGAALQCGFKWAIANGYSSVAQCDADGQHDPTAIRPLIQFAEENNLHLAIGSRFLSADGFKSTFLRRLPMTIMARIVSKQAKTTITDTTSGFRVIREPLLTKFADSFPAYYLGDTFEANITAARSGFALGEQAAEMRERKGGSPSSGTFKSLLYLGRVFIIYGLALTKNGRETE